MNCSTFNDLNLLLGDLISFFDNKGHYFTGAYRNEFDGNKFKFENYSKGGEELINIDSIDSLTIIRRFSN